MSQRIIKFRAWDKNAQKYAHERLLGCIMINAVEQNQANLILNQDQFIWEQFTGFYDRNGVPIYEGDVIESTDITREGQDLTYSGVVCFSDGWYAIETFVTDGYPSCFIPFNTSDLPLILGNKFENPELLK